ncbi:MAG: gluconokinase, partial [Aquificaceae bacterium]|nr:gluconokinase [Aquificaceae bacterium]
MVDELSKKLNAVIVQTHTSWVLILDDVVYKIKKSVNFGFLDYSTLEKRLENCRREVELNRRLCSWVYEDVVPISLVNGEYVIEDGSNPVEYAVKMKKIPEERLLKNMLDSISYEDIKSLAKHIANFHHRAEKKDDFGKIEVMKFNTDENFLQTEKYVGTTITKEDFTYIREKTEYFY